MKILIALILLFSCSSKNMENVGLVKTDNGMEFKPCPKKPNCYSSAEVIDSENYFFPITIAEPKEVAFKKSIKILGEMKGDIVKQEENYIHATFTSSIFKFVDDFQLYFGDQGIIEIKSSSRMGHSDLGVNKKRLTNFTFRYHQSR